MAEFLLEIGCEEIPASWLPGLAAQLRERFCEVAGRELLPAGKVRVLFTPRRLVLAAELPDRQADQAVEVWGPSLKVAKDASGQWTGAAQGFAKKNATIPDALQVAGKDPTLPEDLYLVHVRKTTPRPALEVLPAAIAATLRALAFPKRMNWDAWLDDGKGPFPFGRPIRWIVALFAGQVVPFAVFSAENGGKGHELLRAGDTTRGHRFLPRGAAGRQMPVGSLSELTAKLASALVLLDPEAREARIAEGLAAVGADRAKGREVIEEWRDLVEFPSVLAGSIPAEFQTLPREVLETVLVHHQKYLPIASGGAVTRFAAITNTDGSAATGIVRGMERVVVARLRDGAFFYAEDRKRPLADRVAELVGVTFHQKLGSYREKGERMARLVDAMGGELGLLTKPEQVAAREAAVLAKADLTTLMVREFTELQGVMGGSYLRSDGAPESVVSAVTWHYHPVSLEPGSEPAGRFAGSDATIFSAVSLADKLDTLAGYFSLGMLPTGSSDPYALRRAAQGVIRVLLDFWNPAEGRKRPSLRRLAAAAAAGYAPTAARPATDTASDLEAFLLDRLRFVLMARDFPLDEVEAVLGAREPDALDDVRETWVRLEALHAVRSEAREDFERLAAAFKRARNILGDGTQAATNPELFAEPAERDLHAAVEGLAGKNGDYEARLRALASLREPVDRFFDDVLVMAEDPRLRANRLGLLGRTLSLFYRIADISKLGGQA